MAVGTHALTSLANLKAWLGISSSTYDSVLESAIDRATSIIETYTGRKLKARDIYEWHNGDGSKTVHLDQYPIERMYRVRLLRTLSISPLRATTTHQSWSLRSLR